MGRIALKIAVGLVLMAAVIYLGDWAVWRLRVASGGGMGKIVVSRVVVAKLKANKEEYYADGTGEVVCSQSLFPQAPGGACWWVARHRVVFDR
jgi:hypothetical protein